MEADILKSLKFELGGPTVKTFLRRLSKVAQESKDTSDLQFEFLTSYLAELSLMDYNCVKFLSSLVAASVVFLARFMPSPKTHPWNAALYQLTRYKPAELKECAQNIHDLYLSRRGGSLQAVREKYKQHKVYDYLIDTAARDQTRERTNEFLESVKSHDLAKAEILNIINIRPTNIVEIPSLEELGSRSSGASNKEA